jgi:hypothetical protein
MRILVEAKLQYNKMLLRLHMLYLNTVFSSVADPDPGSGAFLPQGSGIRDEFFPDPGSRIPNMTEIKF